ncbi:MAG: DUF5522 domain-containing protein [Oligoflexus sp.]
MDKKAKLSDKPQHNDELDSFEEGRDYEFNEDGKMVFTAYYLKRRGYCCGNGCRHCPYQENPEITPKAGKKPKP